MRRLTTNVRPIDEAANVTTPTRFAVFVKQVGALARNLLDRERRILRRQTKGRRDPAKNHRRRW